MLLSAEAEPREVHADCLCLLELGNSMLHLHRLPAAVQIKTGTLIAVWTDQRRENITL